MKSGVFRYMEIKICTYAFWINKSQIVPVFWFFLSFYFDFNKQLLGRGNKIYLINHNVINVVMITVTIVIVIVIIIGRYPIWTPFCSSYGMIYAIYSTCILKISWFTLSIHNGILFWAGREIIGTLYSCIT